MPHETEPDRDPLSLRTLLWRLVAGLLTLLVVLVVAGLLVREPVEALASWFVREGGLVGLFVAVTVIDSLPLTHEPVLLLAWSGGLGFWQVWLAASLGSVSAGIVGWTLGGLLGRFAVVKRVFVRYRIAEVFERWGGLAVAVAALTPVPYAVTTWAAGAARVPFLPLLLGCLVRFLKVLIYLSLIVAGWSL
jgi:membrane protein YqaA with SNARE-associated domain